MKLVEKVLNNLRVTKEEAIELYELDLFTLGELAFKIREKRYQKKTFFNTNLHINPTNICKDICKFCAFSANRKNPNPYTLTHDEILKNIENSLDQGIDEVHIVSAHNNLVGLDWYFEIFAKIKKNFNDLHIKALTAAEIDFLANEFNHSYDEIIDMMVEYGVDSMPGGGAEIFDEKIRDEICKGKVSSTNWLKIHQLWHQRGRFSNVTMLFGHVEDRSHRIDHMIRVRDLQDITGGFNAFIPLVYQKDNNYLKIKNSLSSQEILKTIAISRIVLDNVAHIKAYWVTSTINLALVAQNFGADDLDGTIIKESINSAAGAKSANGMRLREFISLIKDSGFIPTQRDSLYRELKSY